jgi:glycosyltransferase involved in cell wall biosynthesis
MTTGRLRVMALVPYPLGIAPGQRYRWEQWAPYLREQGIDITFAPFASPALHAAIHRPGRYAAKAAGIVRGLARRWKDAWSAGHHDVALVYREASLFGPAIWERLAHRRQPRLVYDFDDAVYLPYVSPTNRYLSYLKFPGKTATLCRLAAAVSTGSARLAEYARRYNPRVEVVPSTVSLREYSVRPAAAGAQLTVGWMGSHSSAQYLSLVSGALRRVQHRRPFRFLVVGAEGVDVPGVPTECRRWSAAREVQDLWEMDVGIMPQPDDPWARGKCAMKAIQYMGVGVPAVASPVGAATEVIEPGVNGLLASSEDEWVEALERLLDDAALRGRLGREGRRTVEERFSAEAQAPRVAALLRSVA